MKYPLVSVIIPIYNTEKYIDECVRSVLSQDYRNLEIILIDDGSLDSSGNIIDRYAEKDNRIRVMHKQNEGVSIARNTGIKIATGRYITFVDSDDYIHRSFIKNLVDDMTKKDVPIVTTAKDHDMDKFVTANVIVLDRYEAFEKMFYGTLEKAENGVQMFDRGLIINNKITFDSEKKIGEDFDFMVRALAHCGKIAVDYRRMYYYRPNPDSTMNQTINKDLMQSISTFTSIGERLVREYPRLEGAVFAKRFIDSVSLLMRSYDVREKWEQDIKNLEYNTMSLKWRVLCDRKVRKKVRIAALACCIFGSRIGILILRRIKK